MEVRLKTDLYTFSPVDRESFWMNTGILGMELLRLLRFHSTYSYWLQRNMAAYRHHDEYRLLSVF